MLSSFYIQSLGDLYDRIQKSGIFQDSKTFVDCSLKAPANEIIAQWKHEKDQSSFDLATFVDQYFTLPEIPQTGYDTGNRTIHEHLNALWEILTRQPVYSQNTLIPLPYPYIVPGGRFREIYYWDSYFTQLGLLSAGKNELVRQMVDNFSWLIQTFGFIPNGNRTYYLSRSQPPFFCLMVDLLHQSAPKEHPWSQYYDSLEKEYEFWMDGADVLDTPLETCRRLVIMPDNSLLNRYWDDRPEPRPEAYAEDLETANHAGGYAPNVYRHIRAAAESGWDFSSRWFKDPQDMGSIETTHLIPVDLNALLYFMEKTLAMAAEEAGNLDNAQQYQKKATARAMAIQRWCWDASAGFYKDYNFKEDHFSESVHLGGVYPLFFGLASQEQALLVAQKLESDFLQFGGWVTTLHRTGQQWDAPNGWAPLQWMTYIGLKNYGFDTLAENAKQRWVQLNEKVFEQTGKMMEKYNVCDLNASAGGGEYPNQDGFGWTNGVFSKFTEKFITK